MAASTINTECKRYGCMKNLLACFANCRYTMRCDDLRNELADKTAQAEGDINRYLSERARPPVIVQILKRGVKFDDRAARLPRKPAEPKSPIAPKSPLPIEPKLRVKPAVKVRSAAKSKASLALADRRRHSEKGMRKVVAAPRQAAERKLEAATKRRAAGPPGLRPQPQKAGRQTSALPMMAETKALQRGVNRPGADAATGRPGASRSRKRSQMPRRVKSEMSAKAVGSESTAAPSQYINSKPETDAKPANGRTAPRKKAPSKSRKSAKNGKVYIIIEGQTASVVDEQGLMMHLFSDKARNARYFEASEVEARVQIVKR